MDTSKMLNLKVMSDDLKEIGKVKALEIQNWQVVGLYIELTKEITNLFFGKSAFPRFFGTQILLPVDIVKNVGDVLILDKSGPNLMAFAKLGRMFILNREYIRKSVNSANDIPKLREKINKEIQDSMKEIENIAGISEIVKTSITQYAEQIKEYLIEISREKLGLSSSG
ncbi:MAG: hypothetical protein ACTSQY_04015 [Candidatus Odinarchaeia archaeon]